MSDNIRLIVGLGNIGSVYEGTRHNAGFLFVDELADKYDGRFNSDKKFMGAICRVTIDDKDVYLLKPSTFMNLSGKSVAAVAAFYKITPKEILVVHDELDLPPGAIKCKVGGGSAGHNGLKSIVASIGSSDFARIRIGIGHPRDKQLSISVADYVLSKPSSSDRDLIRQAVEKVISEIDDIVSGNFTRVMANLNEKKRDIS